MIQDISWASTNIFRLENYVPYWNTEVPDDISVLTNLIMENFPKETAKSLLNHVNLKYEDIRVGNNGVCLNYNLLGICSEPNFSYRNPK